MQNRKYYLVDFQILVEVAGFTKTVVIRRIGRVLSLLWCRGGRAKPNTVVWGCRSFIVFGISDSVPVDRWCNIIYTCSSSMYEDVMELLGIKDKMFLPKSFNNTIWVGLGINKWTCFVYYDDNALNFSPMVWLDYGIRIRFSTESGLLPIHMNPA